MYFLWGHFRGRNFLWGHFRGGEIFSGDTSGVRNFLWGHLQSKVYESNPHTIQQLKDNISHAVAAIKITTLHRVYLNMVTARLLTDCSNLLTPWCRILLEKLTHFAASQEIPRIFMEPEGSLPHSQASATCPYPGPAQSRPLFKPSTQYTY